MKFVNRMASNHSSNRNHHHSRSSSRYSRHTTGERNQIPKFCGMATMVKYTTSEKNTGKDCYNCPKFPKGSKIFMWYDNYWGGKGVDASIEVNREGLFDGVQDLYNELTIHAMASRDECAHERKKGFRNGVLVGWVVGFICALVLCLTLVLVVFEVVVRVVELFSTLFLFCKCK